MATKKVKVKAVKAEKPKKEKTAKPIGEVSNYFAHVKAAAIKLSAPLKKGDKIKIKGGEKTDFDMVVKSMQIERVNVDSAKKGDEIGLLVPEEVRKDYKVYKI